MRESQCVCVCVRERTREFVCACVLMVWECKCRRVQKKGPNSNPDRPISKKEKFDQIGY